MSKVRIIVASRSRSIADSFAATLSKNPEYRVSTRVIGNGHADPLHGIDDLPDLLLLHFGKSKSALQYLAQHGVRDQLPLIVCGPVDDPDAMRLAMRAGARDYLPEKVTQSDLITSVERVQEEALRARTSGSGKLIVVANGKGGSGASFLATNLAHSLVVDGDHRVTLVDLDLQFGGLYRYLDMTPKVGILQALEVAHELDEVSAEGYTYEHSSGLRLLAAPSKRLALASEVPIDQVDALMVSFLSMNDYIVADAPSRLDALTELFFERANQIILVVQQTLPHIQDTARLQYLLRNEIGIPKERIGIVVNRFSKNAAIEIADIQKALRQKNIVTIPNQYKIAHESINSGVPVAEISRSAALTKGIRRLQATLANPAPQPSTSILKRALPSFLGG